MDLSWLQTPQGIVVGLTGACLVHFVWSIFYNLYIHPLHGFPGPRLAAATSLYEFYHDVIRRGQYAFKIAELHKRYGRQAVNRFYGR